MSAPARREWRTFQVTRSCGHSEQVESRDTLEDEWEKRWLAFQGGRCCSACWTEDAEPYLKQASLAVAGAGKAFGRLEGTATRCAWAVHIRAKAVVAVRELLAGQPNPDEDQFRDFLDLASQIQPATWWIRAEPPDAGAPAAASWLVAVGGFLHSQIGYAQAQRQGEAIAEARDPSPFPWPDGGPGKDIRDGRVRSVGGKLSEVVSSLRRAERRGWAPPDSHGPSLGAQAGSASQEGTTSAGRPSVSTAMEPDLEGAESQVDGALLERREARHENPVTHSCGHVDYHPSYAPLRKHDVAYLAGRVCRACWVAAKDAAKDAIVKQAEELAAGRCLPALEGTPKMVAWALQLRGEAIVAAEAAFRPAAGLSSSSDALERFYSGIEAKDAARWWVEQAAPGGTKRSDIGPREWLARMFGGDTRAANIEDRGGPEGIRAAQMAEKAKLEAQQVKWKTNFEAGMARYRARLAAEKAAREQQEPSAGPPRPTPATPPPDPAPQAPIAPQAVQRPTASPPPAPGPAVRASPKVGRNAPCPCGSGRKYKKCCEAVGR